MSLERQRDAARRARETVSLGLLDRAVAEVHRLRTATPPGGAPARRCVPRSPATSPARARAVPGAPCRARAGPPRPVPGPCPGPVPSAGPVPGRVARARPVPGGPCRVPCRVPGPCRATCPERIYRAGTPVPAVPGPRPGAGPSCRGPDASPWVPCVSPVRANERADVILINDTSPCPLVAPARREVRRSVRAAPPLTA